MASSFFSSSCYSSLQQYRVFIIYFVMFFYRDPMMTNGRPLILLDYMVVIDANELFISFDIV